MTVLCTPNELKVLKGYAARAKVGILEICVLDGELSREFCLSNAEVPIFGIDPILPSPLNPDLIGSPDKIQQNTQEFRNYKFIKDYSHHVAGYWNTPLDLIFIDGDHDFAAVKKDFDDWFPKLAFEGYLIFHDAVSFKENQGWAGPVKLVAQLHKGFKGLTFVGAVDSLAIFQKKDPSQKNMKYFLTLSERGMGIREPYARLAQVAVLSAQKTNRFDIYFLYDGDKSDVIQWFEEHGVHVYQYQSCLRETILSLGETHNQQLIAKAVYLRLDIPRFVREVLQSDDEYVLFTDSDILFLRDIEEDLAKIKPRYWAMNYEMGEPVWKVDPALTGRFNAGVTVMNIKNLYHEMDGLLGWIRDRFLFLENNCRDQYAINHYFENRIDILPPVLNWRPYWGEGDNLGIIHFHGPKPTMGVEEIQNEKTYQGMATPYYWSLVSKWDAFYTRYIAREYSQKGEVPPDFYWIHYLNNNPDLREAGLDTEAAVTEHWQICGYRENRSYKKPLHVQKPVTSQKKPWYLSAFCMFRDSAPFLKEWIEYHKLVGVEHFFLYSNLSRDHYREVLEPYIQAGEVELEEWPFRDEYNINFRISPQHAMKPWAFLHRNVINDCLFYRIQGRTEWLAIIDSDEFLVPVEKNSVAEFLKDYEEFGGVAVFWRRFGTSGVKKLAPGELMTEKLLYTHPEDLEGEYYVKSIVRPDCIEYSVDSHHCVYKSNYFSVDALKKKYSAESDNLPNKKATFRKIMLNHYFYRTEDDFLKNKAPNRPDLEAQFFNHPAVALYNTFYSPEMLRFTPELKKRMFSEKSAPHSNPRMPEDCGKAVCHGS